MKEKEEKELKKKDPHPGFYGRKDRPSPSDVEKAEGDEEIVDEAVKFEEEQQPKPKAA